MKIIWLEHIVKQQSHTTFSVYSVHYVNHLVMPFQLFIHVYRQCWNHHCKQVFVPKKILCSDDQLIPQSLKLVDIFLSHRKFFNQSELFVVTFFENFELRIQVFAFIFGPNKLSKSVVAFAKIHRVGTS